MKPGVGEKWDTGRGIAAASQGIATKEHGRAGPPSERNLSTCLPDPTVLLWKLGCAGPRGMGSHPHTAPSSSSGMTCQRPHAHPRPPAPPLPPLQDQGAQHRHSGAPLGAAGVAGLRRLPARGGGACQQVRGLWGEGRGR